MIKTTRLILRKLRRSDANDITKNINNKKIANLNAHIHYPYTLKDAKDLIEKSLKEYKERKKSICLAIEYNKEVIGGIDIHSSNEKGTKAEIGYWLAEEYWNKGFMTEAVKELTEFAFKRLKFFKIVGRVLLNNPSSSKVFTKNGYRLVGILKKETKIGNKFYDSYLYEKFR